MSPEAIDHIAKYYSGGLGDFVLRHFPFFGSNWQAESRGLEPTRVSPERWPFIRKVLKEETVAARKGVAYNRMAEIGKAKERVDYAIEQLGLEPSEGNRAFLNKEREWAQPYLRLENLMKTTRKQLRKVKQQREVVYARKEGKEKARLLKQLREADDRIVTAFNNAYARSMKKVEQPRALFIISDAGAAPTQEQLRQAIQHRPDAVTDIAERMTPREIADAVRPISPALTNILMGLQDHTAEEWR